MFDKNQFVPILRIKIDNESTLHNQLLINLIMKLTWKNSPTINKNKLNKRKSLNILLFSKKWVEIQRSPKGYYI